MNSASGYLVDMLHSLGASLNFTPIVYTSSKYGFGLFDEELGSWSGLVGMLEREEVDFSLSLLTMSEERSKVEA